jgi:hypothetical protein
MAIARDGSAVYGGIVNPGTSLTWAHTCNGSTRMLIVAAVGDVTDNHTGATYAAAAMTQVGKIRAANSGLWTYLYALHTPASGANNVVISASSGIILGHSMSYTGCLAQAPDVVATVANTASPQALSLTTLLDNAWLVMSARCQGTITANANTAILLQTSSCGILDTNSAQTPTGSKTMSVSAASGQDWGLVMASIAPDLGGGGSTWGPLLGNRTNRLVAA